MSKECSIDGCPDPVSARGWCNKHYTAWREFRDPLGSGYGECPLCGNPFRISAGHHICARCRRHHEPRPCPHCGRPVAPNNLNRHIRNGCSQRTHHHDFWDQDTCLTAGTVLAERLRRLPTKHDHIYTDRADNGHYKLFPTYSTILRVFGTWLTYRTALIKKCRRLLAEIRLQEAAEGEGPGERRWIAGNCVECGAPVVTTLRRNRVALTCSPKCAQAMKRRRRTAANRALVREVKAKMSCSVCGAQPPPDQLCLIGPGKKMSHLVGSSTAQVKAALAERIPICVACNHERLRLQYEAA